MKTYDERLQGVEEKIVKQKKQRARRRWLAVSAAGMAVIVLALVLFLPYDQSPPDVSGYSASPYYSLIQRINAAIYEKPQYKNNLDMIMDQISHGFKNSGMAPEDQAPEGGSPIEDQSSGDGYYVEVTDNQVAGVIEGDIFKRTDSYVFQLWGQDLRVYSIKQESSELISSVTVAGFETEEGYSTDDVPYETSSDGAVISKEEGQRYCSSVLEMFLSQDGDTIYLMTERWDRVTGAHAWTSVDVWDVSDVANIRLIDQIQISGSFISARMVDEDLLVSTRYQIRTDGLDFSDESTFLPQVGNAEQTESIPAEDIYAPEELSSTRYTVICKIDGNTRQVEDSTAFLSYSNEMYVSLDTIYASRSFWQHSEQEDGTMVSTAMTQITAVSYSGEGLTPLGSVTLPGTVKNQYSMDEYQSILRVVTSTTQQMVQDHSGSDMIEEPSTTLTRRNVSLFCVDIASMEVVSSVEGFAPEGEAAESVRFDGPMGYVCTAEVITMTDPVYFFDLSDVHNITYKDTGTIGGYSTSLVNFGDGLLLGIGYNELFQMKIEIYEEAADKVESLCAYERECWFSEDYKSYFIDREHHLIGLAMEDKDLEYVLLQFDGYTLREIWKTPYTGGIDQARAFMADGWLYVLGEDITVGQIW